jgi:hypothetical protein
MFKGRRVKLPFFLPDIFDRFWKNIQMSNFMKICLVRAEVFHADGRTDRQIRRSQ